MHRAGQIVCLSAVVVLPHVALAAADGPHATTTPIPLTLTDWSGGLSFPKFNSALGTLTGVQLDLSASMQTVLTVTNNSGSPSNGTAKTEVQLSVQDAGNNLTVPQIDLLGPNYPYALGPGGFTTSGLLTKSGNSSDLYTSAAVLAAFNGPGTIILSASTFTQTLLANTGGNTAADQVTHADLTGSVTYFYEPVPEPASLALLGLGSLLLIRGRR